MSILLENILEILILTVTSFLCIYSDKLSVKSGNDELKELKMERKEIRHRIGKQRMGGWVEDCMREELSVGVLTTGDNSAHALGWRVVLVPHPKGGCGPSPLVGFWVFLS